MPRQMTWSYALIAASAVALAACQPASETPEPTVPTPPAPPATTETVAAPAAPETPTVEAEVTPEAHDHDVDARDDSDEHNHDEHEGHDDHAGGEAHVHGHGDLAVSRDGNVITVSLEAPLANFGLSEAETDLGDSSVYADQAVTLNGEGDCLRTERSVGAQSDGQHGRMTIDLTFTCGDASKVTGVDATALNAFDGFSEIDAVILTEADQAATTLTKTNTVIEFP